MLQSLLISSDIVAIIEKGYGWRKRANNNINNALKLSHPFNSISFSDAFYIITLRNGGAADT
jgi:hypothetical protein